MMSSADLLLKDLFAAGQPPARDTVFTLAVMERVERRRFWTEIAMLVPVVVAACVALWAVAPMLTRLAVSWVGPVTSSALLPVLALVVTLAAMTLAGRDQARA
jgi:hypothetical protein